MASSILTFLYNQFFVKPDYPTKSCTGKTVIITGANAGLGFEAARHFVRLGAEKVILACRNQEKGQAALKDIEASEKRTGVLEVWSLDLSSYQSVEEFAKKVDGLKRVDIIIENAGIATDKWNMAEGNEATITTNVLSTFLLALLVLPTLKRTAQQFNIQPRLSITASEVHAWTEIPERKNPSIFDALASQDKSVMSERYYVSKLIEVMTIRELGSQYPNYPVIINCLNPGFCHSELSRDEKGWGMYMMKLVLARTTELGSRTLVAAGLAGRESHGKYMSNSVVTEPATFVTSDEGERTQKRVWDELSGRLEAIHPGILKNL